LCLYYVRHVCSAGDEKEREAILTLNIAAMTNDISSKSRYSCVAFDERTNAAAAAAAAAAG